MGAVVQGEIASFKRRFTSQIISPGRDRLSGVVVFAPIYHPNLGAVLARSSEHAREQGSEDWR